MIVTGCFSGSIRREARWVVRSGGYIWPCRYLFTCWGKWFLLFTWIFFLLSVSMRWIRGVCCKECLKVRYTINTSTFYKFLQIIKITNVGTFKQPFYLPVKTWFQSFIFLQSLITLEHPHECCFIALLGLLQCQLYNFYKRNAALKWIFDCFGGP